MKTIYFVRHGESEANATGLAAGKELNSPLTAGGREQAKQAGHDLKNKNVELIVSSSLIRAHETAKIIAQIVGYDLSEIVIRDDFIERAYGIHSNKSNDEYLEAARANTLHKSAETAESMYDRTVKGLDWLKKRPETKIVLVSHGGISRVLRVMHQNLPLNHMYILDRMSNATVYEFEL
ncbi:hypothetical protein A3F65_03430 [Candidatus Saccharibacteria bacterium RIFCSPHIGHO2_12_FULL_47_16b]|nr:MAG: hypothetical protein A3F65_03430 [Candidatus Saccharibacteria bacterium RIFCSPHIGHO2_12_FULL_47_16b]